MTKGEKVICGALQTVVFVLICFQLIDYLQGKQKDGLWPIILLLWLISLVMQIPVKEK